MGRFRELVAQRRATRVATDEQIDSVITASIRVAQAAVVRSRVVASGLKAVPELAEEITGEREGARFEIPMVLPEGLESGDGRSFSVGSLSRRELPLPLMWQIHTSDGHDGSVVVGRIDQLERTDSGMGNAVGCFDTGPYGAEAERLVRNKMLRFVSADLDKFEANEIKPDELSEDDDAPQKIGADKMLITRGRVMGVTLVAKPAFQEAVIRIVDPAETTVSDGEYTDPIDEPMVASAATLCAAVPIHPPTTWFSNPLLKTPTAITVTDDGRVFGHIASWDMDHIGMPFGTRVPSSRSKYSYFHTGVIRTEEGDDVPVGQLTLSGGHAPLSADAAAAIKHYDETRSAVADVRAGEDSFGVWVSGALRPDVTPEQVRAFRASSPSGDWRAIKGNLELVAVCQVNVPGFPVTRGQVASGVPLTLVAAGAPQLAKLQVQSVSATDARLRRLELAERTRDLARVAAIRARVEPSLTARRESEAARAAAVRDRVAPILAERRARESRALAARRQDLQDRRDAALGVMDYLENFKSFPADKREQLVKDKKALPDGSFPIESEGDLKKAIRAHTRASNPDQAKRHIVRQARKMGKEKLVPDTWSELSMNSFEMYLADAKVGK